MKKLSVIALLVIIGFVAYYFSSNPSSTANNTQTANKDQIKPLEDPSLKSDQAATGSKESDSTASEVIDDTDDSGLEDQEARPATELYASADEAFKAIKDGSADYDDLVLEQFSDLGPDCSWCAELYQTVRDEIGKEGTSQDQKSYFSEILAISGNVENIEYLVDSIKSAKNQDEADLFAESLELTIGNDDVVNFLSTQLNNDNQTLKESAVAAITNQGSLLAATTLFKHTIERGDPDGYYSQGIGVGEIIPDDNALPYLQEELTKRSPYSHLAAKAMLNNGINGLRRVVDILENTPDSNFDAQLISGLVDHISYEEEVEAFLKEKNQSTKAESVRELTKRALADFNVEGEGDTE